MSDTAMRWFGESWGAPMNADTQHAPTPVGQPCSRCDEPIVLGDQGVLMWHVGLESAGHRPLHVDCFVRSTSGPIDHLLHHGFNSCQSECLPDPDWLTPREAAVFASHLFTCLQRRRP